MNKEQALQRIGEITLELRNLTRRSEVLSQEMAKLEQAIYAQANGAQVEPPEQEQPQAE